MVETLKDIIIAGLGVSGSTLAYALSSKGFKITAYDPIKKYDKACGEQITGTENTIGLMKKSDSIITIPNFFSIYVNNKESSTIDFGGSSPWYIVNKSRFVQYLREASISNGVEVIYNNWKGEKGSITVDARGPFSGSLKNKILVKRYILKTEWDPNHVILDFRPNEGGLYWIFPADNDGKLVNMGGGFVNLWNDEILSKSIMEYAKLNLKDFEIKDVKAAPLDVFSQYKSYSDNVFYVGEAAGLVLAISGEGNRPAIESSYALSNAIAKYGLEVNDVKNYYLKLSKKIINDSTLSRKLFMFTYKYRKSIDMVEVLNNIPKWFWYKYLSVNLELNDLIKLGLDLNFISSVIKGIRYYVK
ncbi:NAD(P)/FAD-dependent oxidoreductase [Caldisphaera sp.]|uniref:NAD(P)/FAD-dependent oxidoreductase n=1 Tax=Caldisphaera sp. TaxID=2060322 RepID=UPI0025C2D7B8|nr:NAD(P)/FAD-dependent oxidoreductase [Caldisphaera sp.]